MEVLSHRGFWVDDQEKNTLTAFERSLDHGYGIETDIRDSNGELVISHDTANSGALKLESLLQLYTKKESGLTLALNIKSDGLQEKLKSQLARHCIANYFVFDMSVPDTIGYVERQMNIYTRQSEYEVNPAFYAEARGIWLDEFKGHWISHGIIERHLTSGKEVCIVSPELHRRSYLNEWNDYKNWGSKLGAGKMLICTDYPQRAEAFFNE